MLLIRWCVLIGALGLLSRLASARSAGKSAWAYRTILFAGLLGGVFGVAMDQLTCTLSPDYFWIIKEIDADGLLLRYEVAALGLAAGTIPGLIAGIALVGGCLKSSEQESPSVGWLLRWLLLPALMIVILATPFALTFVATDPGGYRDSLVMALSADKLNWLLAVWGIHNAAYVGGLLGTVFATIGVARSFAKKTNANSASANSEDPC